MDYPTYDIIGTAMTGKKKLKEKASEKERDRKDQEDQSEPKDFGGFPDRDLKKNLGCG